MANESIESSAVDQHSLRLIGQSVFGQLMLIVCFNNDIGEHAVWNALTLRELMKK